MTDEELIKALRAWDGSPFDDNAHAAADHIEALQTKLAKAVDVITCILATSYADDHTGWHNALDDARAALTELGAKP